MPGPKIILAGPGTGKTRTLINEIIDTYNNLTASIKGIIICTFTNKASDELKSRLYNKLSYNILNKVPLLIGTIHSICYDLLSKYSDGQYSDYKILSGENQILFIYSKLDNFGFPAEEIRNTGWNIAEDLSVIFNKITDERIDISKLDFSSYPKLEQYCQLYPLYASILKYNKFLDFAFIQSTFLTEFSSNPNFAYLINHNFNYFYIDEYQDVNNLQNEIFLKLAAPEYNITLVGDDDQSIYGFRGANVRNLICLQDYFKSLNIKPLTIYLNQNHRSSKNLVNYSNFILTNASYERCEKNIVSARKGNGCNPFILSFNSDINEAEFIANTIINLKNSRLIEHYHEISILFRSAKGHSIEIQNSLIRHHIPFKLFGVGNYFDSLLAREFLSLLDLYLNKQDEKFNTFMTHISDLDAQYSYNLTTFYSAATKLQDLQKLLSKKSSHRSCIGLAYDIFTTTDFINRYENNGENIGILTSLISNYDEHSTSFDPYGLWSYLHYLRRTKAIDFIHSNDFDSVSLMTIHQSKGLEFNYVFMPSQNKRSIHSTIVDSFFNLINEKNILFDEERRVFYVGITRAKDVLIISHSTTLSSTQKTYSPNSFITESYYSKDLIHNQFNINFLDRSSFNINNYSRANSLILSYNKIRLYTICPLAYKYSCVWGFQTVRIGGLQFGSNVHKILEIIFRLIKNGVPINNIDIETITDSYWENASFRSQILDSSFRNAAKSQILTFMANEAKFLTSENVFSIEDNFNVYIDKHIITGRFDLCLRHGDSYEIVDFKTGDERDYRSQLSFYSVCFNQKYDIKNPKLAVYFLKEGKKQYISPYPPEKEICQINLIAKKILNNEYSATPGKHCSDCAFNNICKYNYMH